MDHRESSGTATDANGGFAQFVGARRVRRLALSRIGLVGLAVVLTIAAVVVLVDRATRWVVEHPNYQLRFREITLDPPPPDWFRGGAPGFLDRVRQGDPAKETVSVLGLDLKELSSAFRNDCWVDQVVRIERLHPNRVVVHLLYHRPVALARCAREPDRLVDKEGVILPLDDMNEEAARRLIRISGLEPPIEPKNGVSWKSVDPASGQVRVDERVRAASALADFLTKAQEREGGLRPSALELNAINASDRHRLFVQYGPLTMICWGEGLGAERPGQLSAEEKWTRLRDWVQANPNPPVEDGCFLHLEYTRDGFTIRQQRRPQ